MYGGALSRANREWHGAKTWCSLVPDERSLLIRFWADVVQFVDYF